MEIHYLGNFRNIEVLLTLLQTLVMRMRINYGKTFGKWYGTLKRLSKASVGGSCYALKDYLLNETYENARCTILALL
jgi:hypothetical protein